MKFFPRKVSPRDGISDLVEEWRRPQPYRWQILGLAVALTFAIMMLFIPKSERVEPRRPTVTYINSWEEGRTDAEIEASNALNQERKEAAAVLRAEREERRREAFRTLGRASGFDVDALERQYSDDPDPAPPAAGQSPAQQAPAQPSTSPTASASE